MLWMAVTADRFEPPLCVEESALSWQEDCILRNQRYEVGDRGRTMERYADTR
jgi:hypothetical protein